MAASPFRSAAACQRNQLVGKGSARNTDIE